MPPFISSKIVIDIKRLTGSTSVKWKPLYTKDRRNKLDVEIADAIAFPNYNAVIVSAYLCRPVSRNDVRQRTIECGAFGYH